MNIGESGQSTVGQVLLSEASTKAPPMSLNIVHDQWSMFCINGSQENEVLQKCLICRMYGDVISMGALCVCVLVDMSRLLDFAPRTTLHDHVQDLHTSNYHHLLQSLV